jgi:DNA-directed RNA polymerase specialized sigma24 family protein
MEAKRVREIDEAFADARSGNRDAFTRWMRMAEIPIRHTLARYARHVDVEAAMQETLLRMWLLVNDPGRVLTGENASVRFGCRVAANVAKEELRRLRLAPLEVEPQDPSDPPQSDPFVRRAIRECRDKLPRKLHIAIGVQVSDGYRGSREAAAIARMKVNTFLQNLVRARRLLRTCLEHRGVRLAEAPVVKKTEADTLVEQACSPFRERDRSGRILPSGAWLDLPPELREEACQRQLELREIERACDPGGASQTIHAVLQLLGAETE